MGFILDNDDLGNLNSLALGLHRLVLINAFFVL